MNVLAIILLFCSIQDGFAAPSDSLNADSVADAISLRQRTTFTAWRFCFGFGGNSGASDGGLISMPMILSYQRDYHEFYLRYIPSASYNAGGETRNEWAEDVGVLYGWSTRSTHLHASAAFGLGYLRNNRNADVAFTDSLGRRTWNEILRGSIAIPLQAQMIFTFPSGFGAGLTAYASISKDFSIYGFSFSYLFGDWSTPDVVPENIGSMSDDGRITTDSSLNSGKRRSRNALYLELMGSAMLYAVHYERLLSDQSSVSLGASYLAGTLSVPIQYHYLPFKGNSGFECAAGVVPIFGVQSGHASPSDLLGNFPMMGTFFAGYRYQPMGGGDFVRFGWNPLIAAHLFSYLTISLCGGICF